MVPDGVGRKAEGDAKKIEDYTLGSLGLLLDSCLYYVLYYKHIYRYPYVSAYNCITLQCFWFCP